MSSTQGGSIVNQQTGIKGFCLRAWQPVPTWRSTILLFFIVGILLVIIGITLAVANANIQEYKADYSQCVVGSTCAVTFNILQDMTGPVFLYYELTNYYQNHRRYVKSRSNSQLAGEANPSSVTTDCDPVVTNADMGKTLSINGAQLDPSAVAVPCGLIALSLFTDTYALPGGFTTDFSNIAWPTDVGNKFVNVPNYESVQWTNMEDPHFAVWMRTSGLPTFRKLWAQIPQSIPAGPFVIQATSNYDVTAFDGSKSLILATMGPFGGRNYFTAYSYIIVGVISIIISIFFVFRSKNKRKVN